MSPEQLQSARDVDARTDVWSLGIILYELLAGALPFFGDTLPQLSVSIMLKEPEPLRTQRPDVPEQLQAVIEHCLRKNRDERFRTVGAFAAALAPFATPTARISIDRVVRLAGAAPVPAEASGQTSVPAPATPLLSTTTGTSTGAHPASMPPRSRAPIAWIVGGVAAAAVVTTIAFVALRGGGTPTSNTSTGGAPTSNASTTVAATVTATTKATETAAVPETETAKPTPSGTATTPPTPPATTAPTLPATVAKPPPAKTALPTAPKTTSTPSKPKPPPTPKQNDDDPTL
jgi:serine/threonine-protein kinase